VGDVELQLSGVSPSGICDPSPGALAEGASLILSERSRSNGRDLTLDTWGITRTADRVLDIYGRILER
jgi:hypothetical protein